MDSPPIAKISALIGDPARALMLVVLMDGRARTASELAIEAGITRQTASAHLAKLLDGALLALESQGRHRYFRLHSPAVADALETLMVLGDQRPEVRAGTRLSPEREARTCYDHLAGRRGVELMERLSANGLLSLDGSNITLSAAGRGFLVDLGIDPEALEKQKRAFVRPCLDWSERRHHMAGAVGAALLAMFLERGWLRRQPDSRAVKVTPTGRREFARRFDMRW